MSLRGRNFDDILVEVGQFGCYQKVLLLFLLIPNIFSAFNKLGWAFLGAEPDHRCRMNDELNITTTQFHREDMILGCNSEPCDNGWIYDTSTFGSSAVIEFDLVCNRRPLRATAQSLFMLGLFLGSYIFGDLSDRVGRKPTLFIAILSHSAFGLICYFAPDFWSVVLVRIFIGMTTCGIFLVAYVLCMEMVGPKYRVLAGTLCQFSHPLAFFLLTGLAYMLKGKADWRVLQLLLTTPVVAVIGFIWFMPESIRLLLRKRKYSVVKKQIFDIAKINGWRNDIAQEYAKEEIKNLQYQRESENDSGSTIGAKKTLKNSSGISALFRTPNLRLKTSILFLNWFIGGVLYYGLSLGATSLDGNPYINFLVSAAVEIPGYGLNVFTLDNPRLGRRRTVAGFMMLAAIALLATIPIPRSQDADPSSFSSISLVTLSMLGKMLFMTSYGGVYIFSTELFPTEVRNVGVAGGTMCARFGGMISPYVNLLGAFWTPLPLLIYGIAALLAGSSALLLPETLNQKLPETIKDAENFGRSHNYREEAKK